MEVTMTSVKTIMVKGLKSKWLVPSDDCVECDSQEYIRLGVRSYGLIAIVLEDNPSEDAPAKDRSYWSLASCKGYQQLKQLRNSAQAAELDPGTSTLFDPAPPENGEHKRKHNRGVLSKTHRPSRMEVQAKRMDYMSIDIPVVVAGLDTFIRVIRPTQAQDAVYVLYEQANIIATLQYMRDNGFIKSEPTKLQHTGAPGIQRRKDKYVVMQKQEGIHGGTQSWKMCDTLEDALVRQSVESFEEMDPIDDPDHIEESGPIGDMEVEAAA